MMIGPATASAYVTAGPASSGAARPPSTADEPAGGSAAATATTREDPLQDPAVRRQISQLAQRDREVRAHEQAHVAAGGSLITSGPTYSYQVGPDGRRYAVGGEVGIDISPVRGDPEATIDKARRIRAAALAPAEPSAQDQAVAAQASQMESSARLELARQQREAAYRDAAGAESPTPQLLAVA